LVCCDSVGFALPDADMPLTSSNNEKRKKVRGKLALRISRGKPTWYSSYQKEQKEQREMRSESNKRRAEEMIHESCLMYKGILVYFASAAL
jgi:hypothetical protein